MVPGSATVAIVVHQVGKKQSFLLIWVDDLGRRAMQVEEISKQTHVLRFRSLLHWSNTGGRARISGKTGERSGVTLTENENMLVKITK